MILPPFVKKSDDTNAGPQLTEKGLIVLYIGERIYSDLMCMTQDGNSKMINAEQFKDILAGYSLNTKSMGTKYCHFFKKEKKISIINNSVV